MAITILAPMIEQTRTNDIEFSGSALELSYDYIENSDEDVDMEDGGVSVLKKPQFGAKPQVRARERGKGQASGRTGIVAPGELVTDDPQWMR